jgi:hypothetical protein
VKINRPARANSALSWRKSWQARDEVANPMSRFQRFKRHRDLYSPRHWPEFGVKVTAEDATWGLGTVAGLPEGQHLTWAMPNTPWAEFFVGTDPGVPLADSTPTGALVPRDGYIEFQPCGPGFGLGIEAEWLEPLGD